MPRRRHRWIFTVLKLAVAAIVVWGIHRTTASAIEDLERRHWSPAQLRPGWLAASGVLYLLGMAPSGWFWYRVLWALGQRPRWGETLRAYFIGHLGKYVPGKALVVILRTGLIRSQRVDTTVAAVSVFYETLTMMAVGASVAAVLLAVWFRHHVLFVLLALGLAVVAGLPTLPPVFRRLAALAGVGKNDPHVAEKLAGLGYRGLLVGWCSVAIGWLLVGLSLWATIAASGYADWPPTAHDLLLCVTAAALAVVAGFLSLIPGGALVREAVLLELLQPRFGEAGALVSAIVARLVWLVAELLISVILYGLGAVHAQPPDRRPD
jgi:glycosyltransferase 2 family protein